MHRSIGRIILTNVLAIGACPVDAENPRRLPRIGQVFGANSVIAKPSDEAFRRGLRNLGYVDGENVIILPRYAHGDSARFPALLSELIALNVDVLVVTSTAVPAAMQATKTIAIVCPTMEDPVEAGLAASFARRARISPGSTGCSTKRTQNDWSWQWRRCQVCGAQWSCSRLQRQSGIRGKRIPCVRRRPRGDPPACRCPQLGEDRDCAQSNGTESSAGSHLVRLAHDVHACR